LPTALGANEFGATPTLTAQLALVHESWQTSPRRADRFRDVISDLQVRFDREAEDFAVEGGTLQRNGENKKLGYLASAFMQQVVERFEMVLESVDEFVSLDAIRGGVLTSDR
jgi:hypothetical protein